jgi:hypothetical protein
MNQMLSISTDASSTNVAPSKLVDPPEKVTPSKLRWLRERRL